MIVFPAVDLKGGKAVRLRRGRADDATVFADDPVEAAQRWEREGATWLHLVDLDGAFDGVSPHTEAVRRIRREIGISIQLGGGIRDERTAAAWLEAGVTRLIIGTLALEDPAAFARLCRSCPGRIGVSKPAAGRTTGGVPCGTSCQGSPETARRFSFTPILSATG